MTLLLLLNIRSVARYVGAPSGVVGRAKTGIVTKGRTGIVR